MEQVHSMYVVYVRTDLSVHFNFKLQALIVTADY